MLNGLLTYDPDKRLTARQALRHPYFNEPPLGKLPQDMPYFASAHDADANDDQHKRQGSILRTACWGIVSNANVDAAHRLRCHACYPAVCLVDVNFFRYTIYSIYYIRWFTDAP